jgi:hypothetical protein
MMSLTFNKDSWHYAIANFGGFDCYADQDLCTYTRKCMIGLFQATIFGILIGLVVFGLWHVIFGIVFSIMAGSFVFTEIGVVVGCLIILGASCVVITMFLEKLRERRNNRLPTIAKPDSFVKNAYKGWKEKYCIKIQVVDR